MSDKGSVFQKGGGGTNFEQSIQTAFLTTLIIHGNAPCIANSEVIEVAFQTTNREYETDDLLAIAKSPLGQHRLLIQAKHNISFTADNVTFKEVIKAFWKDYNNKSKFDKTKDKLIVIKSGMTKDERNHLKSLFNWAVNHATEVDFLSEVNRIKGKQERLEVFRELLKEANGNTAISDKELWEFLKCVDVLEYDFLNQGSVDETYFLNLIKLCKDKNSTANEKEIWDSIFSYAAILNKDGGSVTIESIKQKDFFKHFDTAKLSPYFKAVEKLKSDSKEILRPIKLTIGKGENQFHLPKQDARDKVLESVSNFQFTIVTGKPGVGKSAEVKEFLEKEFSTASVFVFRADQFNEPTIANVFSSQGVNETIHDVFSCVSLIPDKIIFIDSLEKLLEANPECAFKQLLALLKDFPDIKIISSARRYSIDLITLKFGIDKKELGVVDIPPLDESELNSVAEKFPQLKEVLINDKIKKLLQSPKYLDFAILAVNKTSDDFSNVSLTEFKNKLWNSLVVDAGNIKNGLPIKRENAFMEIAVKRAKEMKLFTKPVDSDAEAIVQLENDEIVFQENQNRRYSPTHDILEDWALVKYVSSKFEEYSEPKELFNYLGNEPAIRRAFRLWVEDNLDDESSKINDLIRASIKDQSIERYWADEILVAVLKSDNSNLFFETFETDLLENNAVLLNRCIHLLRTCCKETDLAYTDFLFLIPTGSGWVSLIHFIEKHLLKLDTLRFSICEFLSDWKNRIGRKNSPPKDEELLAAKNIVLYLLAKVESGDESWQQEFVRDKPIELVKILYNLATISKSEIESLIDRAFEDKNDRSSWKLNSFYKAVIENCLTGIGNFRLINAMPELIVKTAWREWKYVQPIETPETEGRIRFAGMNRLRDEECWGIRDKHSFFPSGIYKTPLYNLLFYHPIIGLEFIIDFINYSVDFYVNADCEYKHKISQIEIELSDGSIIKQWAAWELWAAYRGSSVTNYALESLLKSLEKYLLDTAAYNTDVSKKNLKFMFKMLLKRSNNVAITSVLNSLAIAYPEIVEEEMLPLLTVEEFYEWDLSRALKDMTANAWHDNKISFAQEEAAKSNQLPHRKKYTRGLSDFITNYQFNIGKLNPQIHALFDKLQTKIKPDDVIWKKRLSEIDIRKWEIKPYDEKLGGFVVQPKYEKEVTEFMNSNQDYFEAQNTALTYSGLISKAYEGKEAIDSKKWTECHKHYSKGNNSDLLYDRPVSLALIGLKEFSASLNKKQKKWCLETLAKSIVAVLQDSFSRNYGLSKDFNLMEKEIALSSFHLLMQNASGEEDKSGIIVLMIYMLFAPFADHEVDKITQYVREVFFKQFPDEAKRVWLGLIKYSIFRKANPYFYDDHDPDRLKKVKEKEEAFVQELAADKKLKLDLSEITLEKCEGYLLARAFVISPYDSADKDFETLIKHFIPLLTADLELDEDHSYNRSRKGRQIHFEAVLDAEFYLTELLVKANPTFTKDVLDLILAPAYKTELKRNRTGRDAFEFASKIPEYVIYKLDDLIANSKDENLNKQLIANFWDLWQHFYTQIKNSGKQYFLSTLFLDIKWKTTASHWVALENKKSFYETMVKDFGKLKTLSIQNVFSTVGEKTFLPESISWLVEIFKSDMNTTACLFAPSAERMIQRLFYNHISKIKTNKSLIDDYVWILNRMVDLGSSEAYMFRENVITYKSIA
jgi:flagellar biosynthesis regulator FlaF